MWCTLCFCGSFIEKDPIYLRKVGGYTLVRYGVYENLHDARLAIQQWRRWGVRPYPVRVTITPRLVEDVSFTLLPGMG